MRLSPCSYIIYTDLYLPPTSGKRKTQTKTSTNTQNHSSLLLDLRPATTLGFSTPVLPCATLQKKAQKEVKREENRRQGAKAQLLLNPPTKKPTGASSLSDGPPPLHQPRKFQHRKPSNKGRRSHESRLLQHVHGVGGGDDVIGADAVDEGPVVPLGGERELLHQGRQRASRDGRSSILIVLMTKTRGGRRVSKTKLRSAGGEIAMP